MKEEMPVLEQEIEGTRLRNKLTSELHVRLDRWKYTVGAAQRLGSDETEDAGQINLICKIFRLAQE